MIVELLFFGKAKEIAGTRTLRMELPDSTSVASLRVMLSERYTGLDAGLQYAVAINEVYAENQQIIKEGDAVAILPPVSGG